MTTAQEVEQEDDDNDDSNQRQISNEIYIHKTNNNIATCMSNFVRDVHLAI